MDEDIERVYWTLPQVAKRIGVSDSCARYWAKYFGIKPVRETASKKMYDGKAVLLFERINRLVMFQPQFTLPGAKSVIENGKAWVHMKLELL